MHMDARHAFAEEDNKSQDCAMYLTLIFSDRLAEFAACNSKTTMIAHVSPADFNIRRSRESSL